ncbi:MAG: PAS domain S-box protein [Desulfuromonadales bacterium]
MMATQRSGKVIFILLLLLALTANAETKQLRVGGEDNLPVSSISVDGKALGLFPDVFMEIAKKERWNYEFVPCVWNQCMEDLADGKLDILLATAYSPKRAEMFDFSNESIFSNWGQVYISSGEKVDSILALEGKRIAVVRNDTHALAFRKLIGDFGKQADFVEVEKQEDVFKQIDQGSVNAGVVNRFFGQNHLKEYRVHVTPVVFNPIEIKFAVAKGKHADILAALDKNISKLKQQPNSIYASSMERWLNVGSTTHHLPEWVSPYIIASILTSIGLITGIVLMKYEVRRKTAALSLAKQEAESSQRLYSATLDNTSQFCGLLSPDGTVLNVNQTALEVIGAAKETVVGRPFWETHWWIHDRNVQERLKDAILRCAAGESINYETTNQDVTGKLLYIDFSLKPVRDNSGAIIFLIPEGQDISNRKKIENELLRREQELQSLFMAAPVGIAYVKDRIFLKVNDALCMLYEYSRDELTGQTSRKLYESDAGYEAFGSQAYSQAIEAHHVMLENRTVTKNGRIIDVLMSIAPLVKGDASSGFVTIVLDITDRNKALTALKESEMRFQAIFNESPIVIALNSMQDGSYVDVNRKFLEVIDLTKDAVLGKTPQELEFISAEENQRLREILVAKGKLEQEEFINKINNEEKIHLINTHFIEINATPFALTMLQDVTRRKKAEDKLKESEKRFRTLIEEAPIGISMVRDLRYVYSNSSHARIFGFDDPSELIGMSLLDRIAPHNHPMLLEYARKLDNSEMSATQFETVAIRKDGTQFPYLVSASRLDLSDGSVALSFGTDISERHQALELMIQSEKMTMIAGMAAGMAHEINNPLGIISQNLQNLERRFSPTLPANCNVAEEIGLDLDLVRQYMSRRDMHNYISGMRSAVKRASDIISNMLQFSRHSDASHQLINLNEIIEHSIKLASSDFDLRKKYDFKNIVITKEYDEQLPAVSVCITEIEQVIINLLKNAAQAMFDSGTASPAILIRTFRSDGHAVTSIRDNGPGISDNVRQRIFDPFFTTKDVGSGTGLGLSVSHTIISKNHGGEISVESQPGQGSCFRIQIPIYKKEITV